MINSYYSGADVLTAHNGSADYTRLSPSSIADFFSNTRQWWGVNFLNEPGFEGSTASLLGTIVHYFAEQAGLGLRPANPDQLVSDYLDSQTIDFDRAEIETHWRDMSNAIITDSIIGTRFHSIEQFIHHPVLPGIYAAGTYDAIVKLGNDLVLRDYKTAGKKPSGFTYAYRLQLHTYAWILRQQGINISYIELQYVTKPTKTLPVRTFNFREPFTSEDYDKIDSQLQLIAESADAWNQHPELRYLLAQDLRLKQPAKPQLFKE